MMRTVLSGLLVATCVVALINPVYAVRVTSSQNGLEFRDDFEGPSPGDDPDNGDYPGSWTSSNATITDAGSPGPSEGSQYLDVTRPPERENHAAFSGTASSGTVHAEWMAYFPDTEGGWLAQFRFLDADTVIWDDVITTVIDGTPTDGAGLVKYWSGSWQDTTVPYLTDTWQQWGMDIDIDNSFFTVTVAGVTSANLSYGHAINDGGIKVMCLRNSQDGTTYIDAVPSSGPCIDGDANCDGQVTDADAAILATHWQQCDIGWAEGDFNGDGCATDADAAILATNWQQGVPQEAAAVPEPVMLVLLAGGLLPLWLWRRGGRR